MCLKEGSVTDWCLHHFGYDLKDFEVRLKYLQYSLKRSIWLVFPEYFKLNYYIKVTLTFSQMIHFYYFVSNIKEITW